MPCENWGELMDQGNRVQTHVESDHLENLEGDWIILKYSLHVCRW
jgi:hypothetical protein